MACALLMTAAANAQQPSAPAPLQGGGPPTFKTLIVETVHPYSLTTLQPAQPVALVKSRAAASFSAPEHTLAAHFSAMVTHDFDWFLSTWSAEAQPLVTRREKASGKTREATFASWDRMLKGREIKLLSWIVYGKYVLIDYGIFVNGQAEPVFSDTVALKPEGGGWKLTQELAADPILLGWKAPNGRLQVAPESLMKAR